MSLQGSDHCPVYGKFKDVVQIQGDGEPREVHLLDIMNPTSVFENGLRQKPWNVKDVPAFSAKLMPEFYQRRSIKDMFAKPSTTRSINSAQSPPLTTPTVSGGLPTTSLGLAKESGSPAAVSENVSAAFIKAVPQSPDNKRKASDTPAQKPAKKTKVVPTSNNKIAPAKGQQSLKGFFQPKTASKPAAQPKQIGMVASDIAVRGDGPARGHVSSQHEAVKDNGVDQDIFTASGLQATSCVAPVVDSITDGGMSWELKMTASEEAAKGDPSAPRKETSNAASFGNDDLSSTGVPGSKTTLGGHGNPTSCATGGSSTKANGDAHVTDHVVSEWEASLAGENGIGDPASSNVVDVSNLQSDTNAPGIETISNLTDTQSTPLTPRSRNTISLTNVQDATSPASVERVSPRIHNPTTPAQPSAHSVHSLSSAFDGETVHDPIVSKESWDTLFRKKAAPLCDSHKEPCKSMVTRKKGENQGRSFWMCARPLGPSGQKEKGTEWRCGTFVWCSDWKGEE